MLFYNIYLTTIFRIFLVKLERTCTSNVINAGAHNLFGKFRGVDRAPIQVARIRRCEQRKKVRRLSQGIHKTMRILRKSDAPRGSVVLVPSTVGKALGEIMRVGRMRVSS